MATHQFETGRESPFDLARKLLAEGKAERFDRLVMLRGGRPVLSGSVGWYAKRAIQENARVGPRYVKWRPFPAMRVLPPAAKSASAGITLPARFAASPDDIGRGLQAVGELALAKRA